MASVTSRRNKEGHITSWRVQARHNGKMMSEWFPEWGEEAAWKFSEQVDKRGWASAQHWLNAKRNNPGTPTLEEFTHQYLDPASGMLTGIEPGTRHGYESIARNFLPELGHLPIDAITKDDIGQWVAWVEGQPSRKFAGELIAAKTVANYHSLLSNIFKAAVERNLRPDNPAYRTKLSEGVPREPVFLSRGEFAAIYERMPHFYRPLVAFLVGSQLRWSEATALNGSDLRTDTHPPTVRVNKAWKKNPGGPPVIGPTKTKMGRRTVALWDELVSMMDRPSVHTDLLFRGKRGGKIWYGGFNDRIWNRAVRESGIGREPNIHDLRHTGASWLIADGNPLPFIQHRLGHESITVTINTYGHLLPDAHTKMAASLQGVMAGILPEKPRTGWIERYQNPEMAKISTGTDTRPQVED